MPGGLHRICCCGVQALSCSDLPRFATVGVSVATVWSELILGGGWPRPPSVTFDWVPSGTYVLERRCTSLNTVNSTTTPSFFSCLYLWVDEESPVTTVSGFSSYSYRRFCPQYQGGGSTPDFEDRNDEDLITTRVRSIAAIIQLQFFRQPYRIVSLRVGIQANMAIRYEFSGSLGILSAATPNINAGGGDPIAEGGYCGPGLTTGESFAGTPVLDTRFDGFLRAGPLTSQNSLQRVLDGIRWDYVRVSDERVMSQYEFRLGPA